MTQYLPPNLLALFAPRDPISYLPPADKLPHEKDSQPYSGLAEFVKYFEDPKYTPAQTRGETREERKERKRKERAEQTAYQLEQDLALWDPLNNDIARGDPFKTLFISRINYDTAESKLMREFDEYGTIRRLVMVKHKETGKPRGYAFIEFEHERDMIAAYKKADGKKIDGRRVLIDVERGRTVKGWRPRRLGGGLGSTRRGGNEINTKYSGRDDFDGRDRLLPEDRDHSMRDTSRDRRSRDRGRRISRSRDHEKRKRSRERKRSNKREIKKEFGDVGDDLARKKSRRSRSRDRHRSRSRNKKKVKRSRSRSRSKGKKERLTKVKDEIGEGGYDMPFKMEDGYSIGDHHQQQHAVNDQLPPFPNNNNNNNNNDKNNNSNSSKQYG